MFGRDPHAPDPARPIVPEKIKPTAERMSVDEYECDEIGPEGGYGGWGSARPVTDTGSGGSSRRHS
jgi:hypothetical protein